MVAIISISIFVLIMGLLILSVHFLKEDERRTVRTFLLSVFGICVFIMSTKVLYLLKDNWVILLLIPLYFVASWLFARLTEKKMKPALQLLALLTGFVVFLFGILGKGRFDIPFGVLPIEVFNIVAAILGFLFFIVRRKIAKYALLFLTLIFTILCYTTIYDLFSHKLWYGTCDGRISEQISSPIILEDGDGIQLPLESFRDKYLVICTWNTSFGWFADEFRKLQPVFEKYKDHDNVDICIVGYDCKDQEALIQSPERLKNEFNINIPYFVAKSPGLFIKAMNIYPENKNFLIVRNGMIMYRGGYENMEKTLEDYL